MKSPGWIGAKPRVPRRSGSMDRMSPRAGTSWTRRHPPQSPPMIARSPTPSKSEAPPRGQSLTVAGLFAGIGGIEIGMHAAGHRTALLCEIDPAAQRVLAARFPEVLLLGDIREVVRLPLVDVLAAGFPCQDLSQAGRTAGITGARSGLVGEVFRLFGAAQVAPRWLLLENVPFMLQLDRGKAMSFLADQLEELGLTWAYRVIDARAFGLPQRRQRVVLVASATDDPRNVLFADDALPRDLTDHDRLACGFYWTEGTRGLGWGVSAVPTLKGGSTIGIPSPPAIRLPDSRAIVTPEIRDAERLQGFAPDWTLPAVDVAQGRRAGVRWKLVGNAVSVPLARWVGSRLAQPGDYDSIRNRPLATGGSWPAAAWGRKGERHEVDVSMWPVRARYRHLHTFLSYESRLLSEKATAGFLQRAKASSLHFVDGFLEDVARHLEKMRSMDGAAASTSR
jgi:DNA (cytosine-5)-methyltransferase 1